MTIMAKTRESIGSEAPIAIAPNCGKREAASPPPRRALLVMECEYKAAGRGRVGYMLRT